MSKDDRVTEGAAGPLVDQMPIKRETLESKSPDSRYPHNIKSESIKELIATTAARSQAIYSQEETAEIVWIDWWDFRRHEGTNVSCSGFFTDQAEQLIERLNRARSAVLPLPLMSRTKPAALALPQCLGYILECECAEYNFNHRIGFLYSKPSELYWSTYPRSLRQLLEPQHPLPSKLDRVLFAQRLASCIYGLHSNSWIHGNLSSSSIIFFPEEGRPISYNDFYLSEFGFLRPVIAGFSAKMVFPPSLEEIVFVHPAIRDKFDYDHSQRQHWRSSDIYAFGVMLMEVASWKTIDQVLSISEEGNWRRLLKNENLASEYRLAYVKSLMGEDYAKIVQGCLTIQPSVNEEDDRLLLGMLLTISENLSNMSEALQRQGSDGMV